jgi:putative DNA primase/helicase
VTATANSPKPARTVVQFDNIPKQMKAAERWVCWAWQWDPGRDRWTKVPINPATGYKAKSNNPKTWGSLKKATDWNLIHADAIDGIGFMLGDGWVGVDIDDCLDTNGNPSPMAAAIVRQFNTYTEVSPRGKGLKLIGRSVDRLPRDKGANDRNLGLEVYNSARFFTVTGQRFAGEDVVAARQAVAWLYDEYLPHKKDKPAEGTPPPHKPPVDRSDEELIEVMLNQAKNAAKVRALWSGQWPAGQSHSEADLALLNHIVFYFGTDHDRIDRIFRQSKLGERGKWTERADYREASIEKALAGRGPEDFYKPRRRGTKTGSRHPEGMNGKPQDKNGQPGAGTGGPPEHTDTANAQEFAKDHATDVRWTLSHGWLVWDGRRWKVDDTLAVVERGKATAARLMADAAKEFRAASAEVADAAETDDPEAEARAKARLGKARQALGNAKYCRQRKGLEAMLTLARSIPGIATTFDQFDTQHHLFNVMNGTIDLKTGQLREHRKEDQVTRLAPVPFDAKASPPVFERYLSSTFNKSTDLIDWLKVYLGSCLTGETRDDLLVVFWGSGSNGKSKLIETLLALLGDYAWKAPAEILLIRNQPAHPEERASLCGRRFVACAEIDQGRRLNESLVKELTGDRQKLNRSRCPHPVAVAANCTRAKMAANSAEALRRLGIECFPFRRPTNGDDDLSRHQPVPRLL